MSPKIKDGVYFLDTECVPFYFLDVDCTSTTLSLPVRGLRYLPVTTGYIRLHKGGTVTYIFINTFLFQIIRKSPW